MTSTASSLIVSRIVVRIDEALLNGVLARAGAVAGEVHPQRQARIAYIGIGSRTGPGGIRIHYPCRREKAVTAPSATLGWRLRAMQVAIEEGIVYFRAELDVEGDGVRYTEPVEGAFAARLAGTALHLELQPVTVTLRVEAQGHRSDVASFDAAAELPDAVRHIRVPLPIKPHADVPLPKGRTLRVGPRNVTLALRKDHVLVSAELGVLSRG